VIVKIVSQVRKKVSCRRIEDSAENDDGAYVLVSVCQSLR